MKDTDVMTPSTYSTTSAETSPTPGPLSTAPQIRLRE